MTTYWRLLKELIHRMQQSDTPSYAAALAYNFLFALFPLLLFLTALVAFLHLPPISEWFAGPLDSLVAPNIRHLLVGTLASVVHRRSKALLSLGALGFLWGMSGASRQLIDALNHAYRLTKLRRAWWKTYAIAVVSGIAGGVLLTLAVAVVTMGNSLIGWLGVSLSGHIPGPMWTTLLRWFVLLFLMIILLAMAYSWLPDRRQPFKLLSPGTLSALGLWILISWGFSVYADHFAHYNRTYGSLGAVILLMLYLYLLSFGLLLGAEINALKAERDASKR